MVWLSTDSYLMSGLVIAFFVIFQLAEVLPRLTVLVKDLDLDTALVGVAQVPREVVTLPGAQRGLGATLAHAAGASCSE